MNITVSSASKKSVWFFFLAFLSCTSSQPKQNTPSKPVAMEQPKQEQNILLTKWTGSYGGVPAFDKMNLADLKPAIQKGIADHLIEIGIIANNQQAPTFQNTIEAMEKAGEPLNRAFVYYGVWSSNLSTADFRKVQAELASEIADYRSRISQNKKLFTRIEAVYENAKNNPMPADQQRLVKLI